MSNDEPQRLSQQAPGPVNGMFRLPQDAQSVILCDQGVCRVSSNVSGMGVLPGSFNPIHGGHRQLRLAAEKFLGCCVFYELSIRNVDKPMLEPDEVLMRLQRIDDAPVLLTQAALFTEKVRLFPKCWFVVGYDTAERLLHPEYYENKMDRRDAALEQLRVSGARFLVGGRRDLKRSNAGFQTREHLNLPPDLAPIFVGLPETAFRVDVSSTQIRECRNGWE